MDFDTLTVEPPCIEDVEYGTKIPLDRNGRPVGTSLDVPFDKLARRLIEYYGEDFRLMMNHERAERGMKPL
jgi:hypothetical protein